MTDPSPDTSSRLSAAVASPISRRSVLAGSAFAVPAIMMTTSTPAFAASGLALAFDRSSYSGQACSTISGAKVSASENNAPKAGVAVTVSLSNGYTFANGGTSSTGTTGAGGSLALPDINVPAAGGSGTATATASGATSASASLTGTKAGAAKYLQNGTSTDASGVPAGSTPVAGAIFLSQDGRLIDGGSNGYVNATDVDATGQYISGANNLWRLAFRKKDGTAAYLENGTSTNAGGVPSGSTPVAGGIFLTTDGRLVDGGSNGYVNATNVDTVGQYVGDPNNNWRLPFRRKDGTAAYLQNGTSTNAVGVPAGSTPVAAGIFLTPDGRLVDGGSNGYVNATDVDATGQYISGANNLWRLAFRKKDGTAAYLENGTSTNAVGVPSGSTPVAGGIFLTTDGRLIDGGSNGYVNATNVDTVGQYVGDPNNNWRLPFAAKKTSC